MLLRFRVHIGLLSLCLLPYAQAQLFKATDISPDTPYNTAPAWANTGGRTIQAVVDPTNENTVYLATDIAGVWKSSNAGQSWFQASDGIRNPMTNAHPMSNDGYGRRPLGIDAVNPQRLLYASSDEDLRADPNKPWGGLYYSSNGAGTWRHVDLPNCPGPNAGDILFASGTAYVSTRCGMFVGSGDLTQQGNWTRVTYPNNSTDLGWHIAVAGTTQYACHGNQVYRRQGNSWGTAVSAIVDSCWDLTTSPEAPDSQAYALTLDFNTRWAVFVFNFTTQSASRLGGEVYSTTTDPTDPPAFCCGHPSVWTVLRPHGNGSGAGHKFDIFVSSDLRFYQYDAASSAWQIIDTVHVDTFSVAFPSSYDPDNGNCTAYQTNDGGVFKNLSSGAGCALFNGKGQWVDAMSGLHTMFGYTMALLARPPQNGQPSPAIYLPTGDNETWGTLDGGVTWQDMGCCGDSGKAVADPALPQQMVTMRNGYRQVYRSTSGTPPVATDGGENLAKDAGGNDWLFNNSKGFYDGIAPPSQGAFHQVMTLAGETAEAQGDYLQAVASSNASDSNEIIRTITGTKAGWRSISTYFQGATIGTIQASGGHTNTVVYVLTFPSAGGHIYRGRVNGNSATGTIPDASWQQLSFPGQTQALFADPYDPNVLYVFGWYQSQGVLASSADGGQTWTAETDLLRILTRNGEYNMFCATGEGFRQTSDSCTLNNVYFDRSDANIRVVASLTGAIAFSRDGGRHWISLNDAIDPNQRPSTVVYDSTTNPATHTPSLYYDAINRSMTRIDAPFPTLESARYELRGLDPGHTVTALDATTGKTTTLAREADGVYRGYDDVFDSAGIQSLTYSLTIDVRTAGPFTHTLTGAERSAGVVVLALAVPTVTATGNTCTYNGSPCAGSGKATGILSPPDNLTPVTLSYVGTGSTVYGPTSTPPTSAGTYSLTASFAGNANYLPGTSAPAAITISKATPVVTATGNTCRYNGSPCAGSGTATGVLTPPENLAPVTLSYSGTGGTSYGPSSTAPVMPGTYSVTASFAGNANYTSGTSLPAAIAILPMAIADASLPIGIVGVPYSYTVTTLGGVPPFVWSIISGRLPSGLALNPATGQISGTPTNQSLAALMFRVADSSSPTQIATASLVLTVVPNVLTITTTTLPNGKVGVPYSASIQTLAGTAPFTFSLNPGAALPAGLNLNSATGQISGTPAAAVTNYRVLINVTDSSTPTPQSASASYALTINP